jgi:hypothetical protein
VYTVGRKPSASGVTQVPSCPWKPSATNASRGTAANASATSGRVMAPSRRRSSANRRRSSTEETITPP